MRSRGVRGITNGEPGCTAKNHRAVFFAITNPDIARFNGASTRPSQGLDLFKHVQQTGADRVNLYLRWGFGEWGVVCRLRFAAPEPEAGEEGA